MGTSKRGRENQTRAPPQTPRGPRSSAHAHTDQGQAGAGEPLTPSQLPLQGVRELLLIHLLPLLLDPGVGDRIAPGETGQSAPHGGQTLDTQPPGLCPVPGLGPWGCLPSA